MSSVLVTGCIFSLSGGVVSAQVTFETTFNDSEVRNNIGFTPTLSIKSPPRGGADFFTNSYHTTAGRQLKVVRPSGNTKVVTTASVSVAGSELFIANADMFFAKPDLTLDAQIDLAPEITASKCTTTDQPITRAT
jgi:hypothetical protein